VAAVARVIGPVVERARRAGHAGSRQVVSAAGSTGGR
jgi:cysteine desulfurase